MQTKAPAIVALALAGMTFSSSLAAEDSTSMTPFATTGYTAPSAGAAQTAATAARADHAARADRATTADRADVAARVEQAPTPPAPQTGYVCGGGARPCGHGMRLESGVYLYQCRTQSEGDVTSGVFTLRVDPAFSRFSAGCGGTTSGRGIYVGSGSVGWIKRVG